MENKGKSIIDFPQHYIVMDFETTGFDRKYDDIIEMAALKVVDGKVIDSFSSFVKPPLDINSYITELTGITNDMLSDAPSIKKIMPSFLNFIGDETIVGHNVSFDMNFLCNNSVRDINNDYVDTLRLCRKLYKDMEHHRLRDMVEKLGIKRIAEHRSVDDCEATLQLYLICIDEAKKQYGDLESFKEAFKYIYKGSRKSGSRIDISALTSDPDLVDEDNLFYGKECVFTGTLEKMKRAEAMQLVVNVGGIVSNNVTKKTNYLILGNNDYCKAIKDGKSNKHKKAEQLKLKGQDIEVISEQTFYDVLDL